MSRLRVAGVIKVCLLLSLWFSATSADPERIQQLIAQGDLVAALDHVNDALTKDEGSVSYRFLKGLILTRQERLDDARDIFLGITRSNPELPEPYNNLAVIYAAMGDFDSARQALEDAINTHPTYATAHENMGDIYAKLASQAYIQALELDSGNVAAKTKLALVNELFSTPEQQQPVMQGEAVAAAPARQIPVAGPQTDPGQPDEIEQSAAPEQPVVTLRPEPVAEAAQTPEPAVEQISEQQVAAVKQSVLDWGRAWSAQDVDLYLSFYASDFTPDGGRSLVQWRGLRRQRLSTPGAIQVNISDLVVEMLGQDHAQATFTQRYQSDVYSDRVKKNLLLKMEGGRWLITQEESS